MILSVKCQSGFSYTAVFVNPLKSIMNYIDMMWFDLECQNWNIHYESRIALRTGNNNFLIGTEKLKIIQS